MEEFDQDAQPSRFVVGIDLGTTNSALAYIDTADENWQLKTFAVPQLVAPAVVEARETLPSFHYQRAEGELAPGAFKLPWQKDEPDHAVGVFAREHGALVPGRLIASAKSWLCHSGVDRLAELLPWHGAPDVERLSPVEASARYLAHFRAAWNHRFPNYPLEEQEVMLTLPASFDEVARELTVKAAARAGLPRVVLIEEPQAAFYAWIHAHGQQWESLVSPGQKILVCDIGGGTSDFTLIRVRQQADGKVQFHRVAVGEHLILGGDNLDLALAHELERRFTNGGKLEPRQWAVLVQTSRQVKETLLGENAPEKLVVTLPGSGSRVIGGGLQVELTRDEARQLLVEGFLPRVGLEDKPSARRSGFQEFGLPFAPDAAITRYLAAFLSAHRNVALDAAAQATDHDLARPDIVLFNGGFFASSALRERLLDVLAGWFKDAKRPDWKPLVLDNERLDLAVARGAAYYGMVRRGTGVRISAGLARSYYVGVQTTGEQPAAVCLVPAEVEEGQEVDLTKHRFDLLIRQPVAFPLYVSSTRLTDPPGELVPIDLEQMTALPPISTVLQAGKKTAAAETVPVHLHVRLTEIGTLDLWCSEIDGPGSWRLQFDVRAATRTDMAGHEGQLEREGIVEERTLGTMRRSIERTFGKPADGGREKPEGLMKRLAETLEIPRHEWPPSLLRAIWETLVEHEPGRRTSDMHEARWLNLLGFALRPGYGMAMDDWRVAQTWRLLNGRLIHPSTMCRAEWWILWRRIAGGLLSGQQRALAEPPLAEIRAHHAALAKGRGGGFKLSPHEAAELWRMLGSFELLSLATKVELGNIVLDLAAREKTASVQDAAIWCLGRVGARVPMSGPLNMVVPSEVAADWGQRLMKMKRPPQSSSFALMQMARQTGDRYRDVNERLRREAARWLLDSAAPGHFIELVEHGGDLAAEEQGLVFGESLPVGLRIQ
jgi:molecular chaperone DnaK (HSP70)